MIITQIVILETWAILCMSGDLFIIFIVDFCHWYFNILAVNTDQLLIPYLELQTQPTTQVIFSFRNCIHNRYNRLDMETSVPSYPLVKDVYTIVKYPFNGE